MKHAVTSLVKPLAEEGLSAGQIYKTLKIQYPAIRLSVVYRAAKKLNVKLDSWKPEDQQIKRIRKMIANGLPAEYIAKVMGVEVYQIYNLSCRKIDEYSPYVHNKKINRETYTEDELATMYQKVSRTMVKRYPNYADEIPSAVGDAIIELQNKPKSDRMYAECFGIASRRLIDQLRAKNGRTGSRQQSTFVNQLQDFTEVPTKQEDEVEKYDEIEWLRSKIDTLPEPYRGAIRAFLECGLNYTSTAASIGVSIPTATKYVQLAIKRIKDESIN